MRILFNSRKIKLSLNLMLCVCAVLGRLSYAETVEQHVKDEPQPSGQVLTALQISQKRVHDLLDKAVEHVKQNGIAAVNDFNRDPRFTDNELYVFSLSRTGVMLASGGWSIGMVGQNVLHETDEQGNPFFQTMIDRAYASDTGKVQYLWFNPADGLPEPKITYFKVVDNVIVAVGYFPGFSTEAEARALLDAAVDEYSKNAELALRKFRNHHSEFRKRDQYVFVLDKTERKIIWEPGETNLSGTGLDAIVDVQGNKFLSTMADTARSDRAQQLDYWWFSPITKQVELKRAFYKQVDKSVIAVSTFILEK